MLTLLFIVFICFYMGLLGKYAVIDYFGEEAEGIVTSKDENYVDRLGSSTRTGLVKALTARHKMFYRFETLDQGKHFGKAMLDDFHHQNTEIESKIDVMYLPKYPKINYPKVMLLIRFREMMVIGGIFAFIFATYIAMNIGMQKATDSAVITISGAKDADEFNDMMRGKINEMQKQLDQRNEQ